MTPTDAELKDEILHQTLNLFRYSASEVAKITKRLKAMEIKLIAQLSQPLLKDVVSQTELKTLIKNANKTISDYYGGIQGEFDLGPAGKLVAQATSKSLQVALGVEGIALPTTEYFKSLNSNVLIQGSPAKDWWAAQSDKTAFNFAAQVRQGLANAETNAQIIARIVGNNTVPGIMPVARRDAASLVQTAVQTVANDARRNTFLANDDVIAGIQQISTLDSHTSLICVAYSNATWNLEFEPIRGNLLPYNGGVPRHFNCRSVEIPITKTFKELGLDGVDEPEPTTRASDEGQISAKTDFDNFLKRKGATYVNGVLGKGRANLWRAGKISTKDLVNGAGRPLTLEELQAKFA